MRSRDSTLRTDQNEKAFGGRSLPVQTLQHGTEAEKEQLSPDSFEELSKPWSWETGITETANVQRQRNVEDGDNEITQATPSPRIRDLIRPHAWG